MLGIVERSGICRLEEDIQSRNTEPTFRSTLPRKKFLKLLSCMLFVSWEWEGRQATTLLEAYKQSLLDVFSESLWGVVFHGIVPTVTIGEITKEMN